MLNKFTLAFERRFLRVVLIRQAESQNNVLIRDLIASMRGKGESEVSAETHAHFLSRLETDPGLTRQGKQQAEKLARFWAPIFRRAPDFEARFRLCVGPMLRSLQTIEPLAAALGMTEQVDVMPNLYEAGGAVDNEDTTKPTGLAAAEIAERFGYRVGLLPAEGPWNKQVGGERLGDDGGEMRAASVTGRGCGATGVGRR